MSQEEWIEVSKKKPIAYEEVLVKHEDGSEVISYMYPNKLWMFNKTPIEWKSQVKK